MLKGFLRKLMYFFIIAIVVAIIAGTYYMLGTYSDGDRIGVIIKFSRKGYMFKTYEGQLNQEFFPGGVSSNQNVTPNIWDFSVNDQKIANDIENAMTHGARVKLHYDEKYYRLPWRGETKYIVNKVEEIPK